MSELQKRNGARFKALHAADGIFVMPNAWNAGSACMLEAAGFPAVGTTSAGIAFCLGLPDYEGVLTWEAALEETCRIAGAIRIPVSVDAENGYGHTPEEVAETIRRVADTGAVGASIEDYSADFSAGGGLYDRVLSVERIEAAVEAAASLPFPFTLTARAECYLTGHPNPFEESMARAVSYRDAGADCLYVPGIDDAETIGSLVKEVDAPVNVLMGRAGNPLTVAQLEDLGVKRVSIGGSLARATFGIIQRAAEEIREQGTFTFSASQVPNAELCRFFAGRKTPSAP
ncbi:MAG: isocitrate lyase/phosphoenolpyruvate mutase family protein [Gammaproteobacteria bacterium]|nr:isocitrate lyase/phosphoenolpyruvate mutase family protein [Gammaproteobacteria bacterium]MYD77112.1 isocitrate lyase/phosphoenolpyruvate mutase family protein [Gammaproteobacteria bacterium]MYJ52974.1 isocitrate lyase/phosphoenolpyruvate mutase family protein [Gammaproteobacteria bacterium]